MNKICLNGFTRTVDTEKRANVYRMGARGNQNLHNLLNSPSSTSFMLYMLDKKSNRRH